ncbi:MAG TPA: damage-inducible protein [Stellaceae bacterium]|nr:damage-inducible protein [Stellaceae bacterium]
MPPATPDLASLRRRIQAIESGGGPAAVLPLGIAAVDAALPGGGLVLNGLHEIMGAGTDEEDGAVAAAFAAGLLARLARRRGAPILWCLAADDLYGPGLAAHGLMPDRLVLARCRNDGDILWAMEEGARSAVLAAVLGEIGLLAPTAGRRLQLAAEASGVTVIALRRWRSGELAARQREAPSPALTRWRIAALPSRDAAAPGIGTPLWRVELLRCRGGVPANWVMEEGDATGHVALAAALADGPAAPRRRAG